MSVDTKEKTLPTHQLLAAGQSPWLDFISRELLSSGKLRSMIEKQGLLGVTSNPSIFQNALCTPNAGYDQDASRLFKSGKTTFDVYDELTVSDIQAACDAFDGVFKRSGGEHGFVSLEVDPGLADDAEATVDEAKRLFAKVNRPNVMIKVPATSAGVHAVRRLIGMGININVTLMFSLKHYQDVAKAYIRGLSDFQRAGGDITRVHSVASVFVSRIDTLVDKRLESLAYSTEDAALKAEILKMRGKAAVQNSKLIYQEFLKQFNSAAFKKLARKGAWVQKVLWGSTSTKNPHYSDLLYVEPLVGKETVNTLPLPTYEALVDHGQIKSDTVEEDIEEASRIVIRLKEWGIDLQKIGQELQSAGAKAFCDAFDLLMKSLEEKRLEALIKPEKILPDTYKIKFSQGALKTQQLDAALKTAQDEKYIERLLQKDPGLWKNDADHQKVILNRLGWLSSSEWLLGKLHQIDTLVKNTRKDKIKHVVLLGMGGSSLAPEVLDFICKTKTSGSPRFYVLDTTDPSTIFAVEKKIQLKNTLFIVSSKSGGTVETISQYQYFYHKVLNVYAGTAAQKLKSAGLHFVAITDGGSGLQALAEKKQFRQIFINPSDIGGRYSALSLFGMVPAALMGLPVRELIQKTLEFLLVTRREKMVENNPGVYLGVLLGVLARQGKDKLTLWTSKRLAPFGAWLEQLIAESTGKEGEGIVPIDGEMPLKIENYGPGRVFVVLKLKGESLSAESASLLMKVKKAGYSVIELEWQSDLSIGAEFLRWEIATAVASALLAINPFDEPNVKESKDLTAKFLHQLKVKKRLEEPEHTLKLGGALSKIKKDGVIDALSRIFVRVESDGYLALLAYTERSPRVAAQLDRIRKVISSAFNIPVTIGFGPRYLHSIGQLYKGGPKTGLFVEFFQDEQRDANVPGSFYRFGQLKKAQAMGDYAALYNKNLPVMTVNVGKDVVEGLKRFSHFLTNYLKKDLQIKF